MRVGFLGAGRIGVFHAEALAALPAVDEVLIGDADPHRAAAAAGKIGGRARAAASVDEVFAPGAVDAVAIATSTSTHEELIVRAARAGLPAYCEKPVALGLEATLGALREVRRAGTTLQMGFQRRFDAGYTRARQLVRDGSLGTVHTVRALTSDAAPPPAEYIPTSGGLYRDCLIHDFDVIRWVTGREAASVYAVGANRGADFFREAGDVDTAAVVLTLDDGTLATATATRYNGAGYDVRMEVAGTRDQVGVGLDAQMPMTSAEPNGPGVPEHPYQTFLDRFNDAYRAELATFVEVAAGRQQNPCAGEEALAALLVAEAAELSRAEGRAVTLDEIHDRVAALGGLD
ncbi:dehydrogenase [Mangrovactinospora gilvigrisea]|uniref:Dehydrogenase n=1 Tax=Mangrovactinospora gilvigrisea TaxID=1428644 RepID=A0A1J7BC53_9ACTN|nr:Gfo/Idh/MocA family oxidoreductase [Mangrovactinospora gilvigrisea]OIV36271.1 dehydrogenase [Mangrovactinospora gilvigrisea]